MLPKFLNTSTLNEDVYRRMQFGELITSSQHHGVTGVLKIINFGKEEIEFRVLPSKISQNPIIELLQPYQHLEANKPYEVQYQGWAIKNEYFDGFCVIDEDVVFLMYLPVLKKFKVPESYFLVPHDEVVDTTFYTGQKGYITYNDEPELPIEVLVLLPSVKGDLIELRILSHNKYFRVEEQIRIYAIEVKDFNHTWTHNVNYKKRHLQLFLPRSVL